MRFSPALLGLALLAAVGPGQSPAQETRPGPLPEVEQQIRAIGPVIDVPATQRIYKPFLDRQEKAGVRRVNDLSYGPDERNKLDLFAPEQAAAAARPVLIFVHGGGFIRGDKSDRENVGYFFARNDILTLVPSYRLAPKHRWPAGAEDMVALVAWARANAAQHGGDPNRIFLVGESAGAAHIAAATLMKRFSPAGRLPIAGAVLVSGPYDAELELKARRQFGTATPDPRNEAYFGTDFAAYRAMSTLKSIDAAEFPLLITYAELDPVIMQVSAGALFAALCERFSHCPELNVIRRHSHISQSYSFNTGDLSLAGPILDFVRATP